MTNHRHDRPENRRSASAVEQKENMKKIIVLGLLAMTLMLSACGTAKVHQMAAVPFPHGPYTDACYDACGNSVPYVYGGTVEAARLAFAIFPTACELKGEGGLAFITIYPLLFPFLLADIPLSLVADTIALPYDVYKQRSIGNICPIPPQIRDSAQKATEGRQK